MQRIKDTLIAIQAAPERAAEILQVAIEADRDGFVLGMAAFIVAALDGVVPDPEKL